jgi:hypothetical protein
MAALLARALVWFILVHDFAVLLVSAGLQTLTIDDTDPAFNYSSTPAWDTSVWDQQSPQPLNNTNHGSPTPGAQVTFKFTGTAFSIFGYKAVDQGPRTITVDGTPAVLCNGQQGQQGSRALVFSRENMSNTEHTVVIQNTGSPLANQYVNIDYATVVQESNADPTEPASSNKPMQVAAVAGGAAGGSIAVFVLAAFMIWRCKLRRKRLSRMTRILSHKNLDWDDNTAMESGLTPFTQLNPTSPTYTSFAQFPTGPTYPSLSKARLAGPSGSFREFIGPRIDSAGSSSLPEGQDDQNTERVSEKGGRIMSQRPEAGSSRTGGEGGLRSTEDAPPQYTAAP